MATDETLQKRDEESESEDDDDDVVEAVPKVDVDPSKLTPLSPEVISKQVSTRQITILLIHFSGTGNYQLGCD
jgi:translation initiation factor 2 subunit 3